MRFIVLLEKNEEMQEKYQDFLPMGIFWGILYPRACKAPRRDD